MHTYITASSRRRRSWLIRLFDSVYLGTADQSQRNLSIVLGGPRGFAKPSAGSPLEAVRCLFFSVVRGARGDHVAIQDQMERYEVLLPVPCGLALNGAEPARVTKIVQGGPAAQHGVTIGSEVLAINGQDVRLLSHHDCVARMRKSKRKQVKLSLQCAVVTREHESLATPSGAATQELWRSGLFDCLEDLDVCCYGTFCLCCLLGDNGVLVQRTWNEDCCCSAMCPCCVTMAHREYIQTYHNLEDDCGDACMVSYFCFPCAACQHGRELNHRQSEGHETPLLSTQGIICPHCGAQQNNTPFCTSCGNPLGNQGAPPLPRSAAHTMSGPQGQGQGHGQGPPQPTTVRQTATMQTREILKYTVGQRVEGLGYNRAVAGVIVAVTPATQGTNRGHGTITVMQD